MMKSVPASLLAILVALPVLAQEADGPIPAHGDRPATVIAAGTAFGVGFVVAGATCAALEAAQGDPCAVRGAGTSLDRLQALMAGEVDAAIVQSDWLMRAIEGDGLFEGAGPNGDLVALAGLHSEDLILLSADPGGLDALAGAAVDLGAEGSYTRLLGGLLMDLAAVEADPVDDPPAGFEARLEALCAGDAPAAAFLAAQPHAGLVRAAERCGLHAVGWPAEAVAGALEAYPGLVAVDLPRAFGGAREARTLGLRYLLVARKDMHADRARALTAAVLAARPRLAERVASWRGLSASALADVGSVAAHPGAEAAFADANPESE